MYEEIDQEYLLEELIDRLNNLIRIGQICEVRADGRVKVKIGEIITDWLDVLQNRASKSIQKYSPPTIYETVLIISPLGDLEQGYVLPGLFTEAIPAPESDCEVYKYIKDSSKLTLTLKPGKFVVSNQEGSLITAITEALEILSTAPIASEVLSPPPTFEEALKRIKSFDIVQQEK